MDVQFIQHRNCLVSDKDTLVVQVNNADISIVNAVRRIMISEVPTIAVNEVRIVTNGTVYNDEYIAHRLALVPISITRNILSQINYADACNCESYCDQCTILFEINVTCDTDETRIVTTDDMRTNHMLFSSQSPFHKLTSPIPIVVIKKGQSLQLIALATKGIGQDHAKWSPVTAIGLKTQIDISVNQGIWSNLSSDAKNGFIQSCPSKVYEMTDLEDLGNPKPWDCTMCGNCVEYADSRLNAPKLVELAFAKRPSFLLTIESTGSLDPYETVLEAFVVLKNKLSRLKQDLILVNK